MTTTRVTQITKPEPERVEVLLGRNGDQLLLGFTMERVGTLVAMHGDREYLDEFDDVKSIQHLHKVVGAVYRGEYPELPLVLGSESV